jgi:hypothetical protein
MKFTTKLSILSFLFTFLLLLSLPLMIFSKLKGKAEMKNKTVSSSQEIKNNDHKSYITYIYIDNESQYSTATLQTNDIQNDKSVLSTEKEKGFYFIFTDYNNNLDKVFLKSEKNKNEYYLPYKNLSSMITYTNPILSGKYLTAQFQGGQGSSHKITIQFEFHLTRSVISEEEIKNIVNWLNKSREKQINLLSKLKSRVVENANSLSLNMLGYNATLKGMEGVESQISVFEKGVEHLQGEQKSDQNKTEILYKQIEKLEQELTKLKEQAHIMDERILHRSHLLQDQNDSIRQLKDLKNSHFSNSSIFKTRIEDSKRNFTISMNEFIKESPFERSVLNSASDELIIHGNIDNCTHKIKSIYP